jgi:energy-coupling factor transport system ATP-binding protein
MTSISVEALTHVYPDGEVRALDGVDLRIDDGESLALVGQNGSGKSTLARHMNGLLRPTAGHVLLDGQDTAPMTVATLARSVGLCFQDPDRQVFSGSVRAEVAFGPRNLGLGGRELDRAVEGALHLVGLDSEAAVNPYDLGYSRRKLLATASVLAMGTPVVILDEPTTGQDARGVARIGAIVDRMAGEGRTVIAISHDMSFVTEHFRRVVVMRSGRVVIDGTPAEVFAEASWPTLASSYLEATYAARAGAWLGLGSTPTIDSVVEALRARSGS